ncbi:MAG: ABC transporter ATP-binding protein, partial [Arenibacter algicola]|nr:ABC transporter ATP-binding protein [Arenibacter algicola]
GQLASYSLNRPSRVDAALTEIAQMMWNVVLLCVYLALMIAVAWKMTLAAFAFMEVMTIFLWRFSLGPIRRFGSELTAAQERVNQTAYESIDCMKLIRIMNDEQRNAAQLKKAQLRFSSSEITLSMLSVIPSSVLTASAGVFICLLLYSAASLAPEGSSEWGPVIMLFLFLTFRLLGPVSQINLARNSISGQIPAFDQLEAFFDYCERNRQSSGDRQFEHIDQAIELRDVSFRYPKEADRVISNLNMTIQRGKTIALVGPSGAGKSTVTALLARFYDPEAGEILVDGHPLVEYDLHSWRASMAFVSQDISIFNASVADNLRIGKPNAGENEMWEALELAA